MSLNQFGAWSEQKSSKGKIYYYNKDTEVSQWTKPREWQEYDEQLQESFRLEQEWQMQMAFSMTPMGFFPPPPFFFSSNVSSSAHMADFSFPPSVSQPYPTTVAFVPPPPQEHQYAKPALSLSNHAQSSPAVHLESKVVNLLHSNVTSSAKHTNESPAKPHPYSVPSTISSNESMQQPCSSKASHSLSTVSDCSKESTAGRSQLRSRKKSPNREMKKRDHTLHHESSHDANQPPLKKSRDDTVPAPDWELQPWARFYKPDMARKLRKKFNIGHIDELNEHRQISTNLEKKLLAQLKNVKLATVRSEVLEHTLKLQNMEKAILQKEQKELQANIMTRREAIAEFEEKQKKEEGETTDLLDLFE